MRAKQRAEGLVRREGRFRPIFNFTSLHLGRIFKWRLSGALNLVSAGIRLSWTAALMHAESKIRNEPDLVIADKLWHELG